MVVGVILTGVDPISIFGEIIRAVNPLDGLVVLTVFTLVVDGLRKR